MSKRFGSMDVFYPEELFDVRSLDRVIENTLQESARAVQVELRKITQTWKHRPKVLINREKYARFVRADTSNKAGQVFEMLDAGTRPHVIKARNVPRLKFRHPGFVAKTTPRQLVSGPGKSADGPMRSPVQVNHPGTKKREWYETTQAKWDAELPVQFQRAIDAEVARKSRTVKK